jgi:hypothetical protein
MRMTPSDHSADGISRLLRCGFHTRSRLFDFSATYTRQKERRDQNEINNCRQDISKPPGPGETTHLNCAAVVNFDTLLGLPTRSAKVLNLPDNIDSFNDFTENDMFPIEPCCNSLPYQSRETKTRNYSGDEELGPVCVRTGICHGKKTGLGVLQFEVFVIEPIAIDGFSTRSAIQFSFTSEIEAVLVTSEISPLDHKIRNNAMESTVGVSLSRMRPSLFSN